MPLVDGYEFRRMLMSDSELKQIPLYSLLQKGREDVLDGYDMGYS